jgi:hypothetical protein
MPTQPEALRFYDGYIQREGKGTIHKLSPTVCWALEDSERLSGSEDVCEMYSSDRRQVTHAFLPFSTFIVCIFITLSVNL